MVGRERIILILRCEGLGDCLFAIPVIKKMQASLKNIYDFEIYTHHVGIFKSCPYVIKAIPFAEAFNLPEKTRYVSLFNDQKVKHWEIDTFDYISIDAGAGQLSFREKQLEYFPAEPDLSEHFDVVVNTAQTWPTRTWSVQNWQRLVDHMLDQGMRVAVIGKDVFSKSDNMTKNSLPLVGCINLINQLSLDQTYYTIKNCGLFISCQNGLSVLSGATDTEIVILGMSIEWSKRAIYRNGNPYYKVSYVSGGCQRHCCDAVCRLPEPEKNRCQPSFESVFATVDEKLRTLM